VELFGHEGPVTVVRCLTTFGREDDLEQDELFNARDDQELATGSMDGTIRLWYTGVGVTGLTQGHGYCLSVLELGVRNPVADLILLSPSEVVVGTWDGQLRVVDLVERLCSRALQATGGQVRSCCKWRQKDDPEWQFFVGTDDGAIACWSASTVASLTPSASTIYMQRLSWQAHTSHVVALCICKDWLLSLCDDKLVRVWDATSGRLLADYWGHSAGPVSFCVAWKEKLLWTGSRDHSVRSWDLGELESQVRERSAMEQSDAESFEYEVTFSRLTAKQLRKMAQAKSGKDKMKAKGRSR